MRVSIDAVNENCADRLGVGAQSGSVALADFQGFHVPLRRVLGTKLKLSKGCNNLISMVENLLKTTICRIFVREGWSGPVKEPDRSDPAFTRAPRSSNPVPPMRKQALTADSERVVERPV
jgi:hypothetical protein